MATKTSNVTARVEPEVKEQAETILSDLGMQSISSIGKLSFGTDCRFVPPFLQRGPNPEVK